MLMLVKGGLVGLLGILLYNFVILPITIPDLGNKLVNLFFIVGAIHEEVSYRQHPPLPYFTFIWFKSFQDFSNYSTRWIFVTTHFSTALKPRMLSFQSFDFNSLLALWKILQKPNASMHLENASMHLRLKSKIKFSDFPRFKINTKTLRLGIWTWIQIKVIFIFSLE